MADVIAKRKFSDNLGPSQALFEGGHSFAFSPVSAE